MGRICAAVNMGILMAEFEFYWPTRFSVSKMQNDNLLTFFGWRFYGTDTDLVRIKHALDSLKQQLK